MVKIIKLINYIKFKLNLLADLLKAKLYYLKLLLFYKMEIKKLKFLKVCKILKI